MPCFEAMLAVAMILDAILGETRWLRFGAPHPIVLIGNVISCLEERLNTGEQRRVKGVATLAALIFLGLAISLPIAMWQHGWTLEILGAAILIAQRSLVNHVRAVADGLRVSLDEGRRQVAMIVGRDPDSLDNTGVARAAIESAAENFSDGVAAPIFWFAVAGLPGILIYKIVNTADSMIGHRTARYEQFGWASARLDDLLNLVPARLSGAMFALVGASPYALRLMLRDASMHRSPNAGWPESAIAGLLGIAVAGPRRYGDQIVDDPYINAEGRRTCTPDDIDRAVSILWRAWSVTLMLAMLAHWMKWSLL